LKRGISDSVYFEEVEVNTPLWNALAAMNSEDVWVYHPLAPQAHWYIDLPENNPSDYWKKYSSKDRREMRSRAKNLTHELIRITLPEQVPYFLEQASMVASKSWQGKRLGGRIQPTAENRVLMETLARAGALRSYLLQHEGKSIAYIFDVQWQREVVGEEMGFDLEFSKFKPGHVLMHRSLEDLIEFNTPLCKSMGFGDAQYKKYLGTRTTMTAPVVLARRSLRPMIYLGLDYLRKRASRGMRRILKDASLMQKIRQKYRR
jgi:CelD/BcsL family acetyltransferase involved in cellulose biosynthesis